MRYAITSPERHFSGEVAGVAFTQGHAEADDVRNFRALTYFRRKGYGVDPITEPAPASESTAEEGSAVPAEPAKKPTGRRSGTTIKETP